MSKQCMRIELTYSDGTREFAAGDDAAKIMEWWGSCEGMNYIHGARYTGPQLQAAESDLLQRALDALEAIKCVDCRDGVLLCDSLMFDLDREDETQPCPNCVPRLAVLREAGRK